MDEDAVAVTAAQAAASSSSVSHAMESIITFNSICCRRVTDPHLLLGLADERGVRAGALDEGVSLGVVVVHDDDFSHVAFFIVDDDGVELVHAFGGLVCFDRGLVCLVDNLAGVSAGFLDGVDVRVALGHDFSLRLYCSS